MKNLSIIIIAVFLVGSVIAQPPMKKDFQGPKGPDMGKMQIILDLTDDQVVQWKELDEKHQAEQKARHEQIQAEREAQMEKMKAEREMVMEQHLNELKQILTPEQFKKFEAMRPEHPHPQSGPEGKQGQHPGHGAPYKGDCSGKQGATPKGNGQ